MACPWCFDEDLLEHDRVWAAGGDGHSLFEVDPKALAGCTSATVAASSSPSALIDLSPAGAGNVEP